MQFPDLIIIALVEGVADILPLDGSAHALLVSRLLGWRAGSIAASVHLGIAAALLVYLWRDMLLIVQDLWKLRKRRLDAGARLAGKALLGALPWLLATYVLKDSPPPAFLGLAATGAVTILAALLMGLFDKLCMTVKRIEHLGGLSALAIGLVQLLALIPGVGRVAAGLTAARVIGLERPDAFRFVLLANLPILLLDGGGRALGYYLDGRNPADSDLLAFALSALFGLIAVAAAMAWIRRSGLLPFALYRLLLGAALIGLAFV